MIYLLSRDYYEYFNNGKKLGIGKLFDKDGNLICSCYWNNEKFFWEKNYNEHM